MLKSKSLPAGVLLIWLCFVARGLFYCSYLPLWEGYDEWSHFAYIQFLASHHGFMVDRNTPIPRDVATSLRLAPVPWELRTMPAPSLTGDVYWKLPAWEVKNRENELAAIPAAWADQADPNDPRIYEALQAPLYYWFMSVPCRIFQHAPLVTRVFLLRYLSLLTASISIPIIFFTARRFLTCNQAMGVAGIACLMPGFMLDVSRVGNDCLGVLLYSGLTLALLEVVENPLDRKRSIAAGILLGLGLLTKAYFLAAVPAVIIVYAWLAYRSDHRRSIIIRVSEALLIPLLMAGWWYVYNFVTTGTWSGLSESVMLRGYSGSQMLAGALHVNWPGAIDAILLSHIWFGGWSSLQVRSWIYHFFYLVGAFGAIGLGLTLVRRKVYEHSARRGLCTLLLLYVFFWAAQLYNALLLFLSKGASTSMGWYMDCLVAIEALLVVVGLTALAPKLLRSAIVPGLALCAAALDLYTVHFVSLPYYTGLIEHRANGSLQNFHLAQLHEIGVATILTRSAANKPGWLNLELLAAQWSIYVVATVTVVYICSRKPPVQTR